MKNGFTLAEVLITLGIIGVVAAITMPTIIRNYKKNVVKSQLKSAYSILSQAYNLAFVELGYTTSCYYGTGGSGFQTDECTILKEAIEKNLKTTKICRTKIFTDRCVPEYTDTQTLGVGIGCNGTYKSNLENYSTAYVLPNGQIVFQYASRVPSGINGTPAIVFVDINGFKGPNKWGHDVFGFTLSANSSGIPKLLINASASCATISETGYYDRTDLFLN